MDRDTSKKEDLIADECGISFLIASIYFFIEISKIIN